eukprot:CAMPEP_0195030526 /NCGR_PEP_ID=MMETSP0326_2-20130528/59070_1 /TAXON_ID=2866 ORGANISM="Crypthecodinium cohnii, Strain Seligo" /NCGR_SAMPLE_ID=MMETSP0326_2 /ASSEMBLY_ACC=CAM_ASM_000348 /LENGTH=35 /DNA_ID= /DNA_START= /DNA_END= /DNA_ORIENTATION=
MTGVQQHASRALHLRAFKECTKVQRGVALLLEAKA